MTMDAQMDRLHILGGPQGGTVSTLAIAVDQSGEPLVFMGNTVGLFCARLRDGRDLEDCRRLPNAPLGIMALAASPQFAQDGWLIAGTDTGLYLSNDAGASWQACPLPMSAMIPSLACSPHFAVDGIVLASTSEDGIWFSQDRGRTWQARNFGLLDSTVFCIAFSPNFATDATVFIGTDGALYHSYNGARAWKECSMDGEVAPIVSLVTSPTFSADGVVLAGTERTGLWRSSDRGANWDALSLPAQSINAIAMIEPHCLIAATDAGLYRSDNVGQTWQCLADIPHALCLASHAQVQLAGLNHDGLVLSADSGDWTLANAIPMRALSGLVLSPQFHRDHTAFMFGPHDGIWRTVDGGAVWHDVGEAFPGDEIINLIAFQTAQGLALLATSANDLLLSLDHADHWREVWDQPVQAMTASAHAIAIADPTTLHISTDLGAHWQTLPAPWPTDAQVLALTMCDDAIGAVVAAADGISVWIKTNADWRQLVQHELGVDPLNPQVRFYRPDASSGFVSIGHRIWRWDEQTCVAVHVFDTSEEIIALAAVHGRDDLVCVCTHRRVLFVEATPTIAPTVIQDFGDDRAVAFALAPHNDSNTLGYVMLLGGRFAKIEL